jgi:large subunit ribosomal protein L3
MGNARVTVQNLKVVLVDAEKNLLAVKGAIPGAKNGLVIVREARKSRGS